MCDGKLLCENGHPYQFWTTNGVPVAGALWVWSGATSASAHYHSCSWTDWFGDVWRAHNAVALCQHFVEDGASVTLRQTLAATAPRFRWEALCTICGPLWKTEKSWAPSSPEFGESSRSALSLGTMQLLERSRTMKKVGQGSGDPTSVACNKPH